MIPTFITNNFIDIYAIGWCLYLVFHSLKHKRRDNVLIWAGAQTLLFIADMIVRFVNKGFCVLPSCEPTNTLIKYFDGMIAEDKTVLIRFISMSLMFVAILRLHNLNEKFKKK